jgi:hypothetical protein
MRRSLPVHASFAAVALIVLLAAACARRPPQATPTSPPPDAAAAETAASSVDRSGDSRTAGRRGRAATNASPLPDCGPTVYDAATTRPLYTTDAPGSGPDFLTSLTDQRYATIGDRAPLRPHDDANLPADPGPDARRGAWPIYDTSALRGSVQGELTAGNIFTASNINAIYQSDLWTAAMQEFAYRVAHMNGEQVFSILDLESGVGRTRRPALDPLHARGFDRKYGVGSFHQAIVTRGSSLDDAYSVVGAVNIGTASLGNDLATDTDETYLTDDRDPNTPGAQGSDWPEAAARRHVASVVGSENDAWVSREIGSSPWTAQGDGGAQGEPWIGAEIGYHEDDYWDARPSSVGQLAGLTAAAILDGKKAPWEDSRAQFLYGGFGPDDLLGAPELKKSGFVQSAVGASLGIFGLTRDSWINVHQARGLEVSLSLLGDDNGAPWEGSPDYFSAADRCDAIVRDWVALSVDPATVSSEVMLVNGVGLFVADQDPAATGDQSLVIPEMIPGAGDAYSRDSWAGIVTRANVVVGDGYADPAKTGFDRDLINVDGALRLAEGALPARAANVPDAEMIGMVAFSGGRLWLAMPRDEAGGDTTPIWRAVALEEDHLERDAASGELRAIQSDRPDIVERAPAGARGGAGGAAAPERLSTAERYARRHRAATDAVQRQSVPRMQVITEPGNVVRTARGATSRVSVLFNQVDPSHFAEGEFTLAWRREGRATRGGGRVGEMGWQTIDESNYEVRFAATTGRRPPVPEIVITGVDFGAPNATGDSPDGATIQLMAVTAHGNIASTSFRLAP